MMKRIALGVVRLEWPILAVLTPLLLLPNANRSAALLGIPLLWSARKIARGHFVRRTPLDWAITLLMTMVLVSLFATYDIRVSLPRVTGVILGVAVYYATVETMQSPSGARWATGAFLAAGIGVAGLALVGMQTVNKMPVVGQLAGRLPRVVRGISENPEGLNSNIVAGALLWFIPLAVMLAVWLWQKRGGRATGTYKAFGAAVCAIYLLGVLVLTQSRSAAVSLIAGGVFLAVGLGRRGQVAAVAAMVLLALVFAGLGPAGLSNLVGLSAAGPAGGVQTLEQRAELWSRAAYIIQDFPLTGMGMGTLASVMPVMYPTFSIDPSVTISHVHDEFLQVGVDLGLPGLVAFLTMYLTEGWMLVSVLRRDADSFWRYVALGLLAGLGAHAVYGLTDAVLLGAKPSVFWWALLGLGSGLFLLDGGWKEIPA